VRVRAHVRQVVYFDREPFADRRDAERGARDGVDSFARVGFCFRFEVLPFDP